MPTPILTLSPYWVDGHLWAPEIDDRSALWLLKKKGSAHIGLKQAYRYLKRDPQKVGPRGFWRSLIQWLQERHLAIAWKITTLFCPPISNQP